MKWALFSILILVLSACSHTKKTASTEVTPIITPKTEQAPGTRPQTGPKTETPVTPADTSGKKQEKKDEEKTAGKEKNYSNIAVILPFMTSKVPLNYTPFDIDTNIYLSPEMIQSLDFYMGMRLAVDDFRNKGKKINLFVLDDANNDAQTKKLLNERPFPDVDLIIGPYKNGISKDLLQFADKNDIPVVSPFLADPGVNVASEHFYAATPSLQQQLVRLVGQAVEQFPERPFYIIWDPAEDSSKLISQLAEGILKNNFNRTPVRLSYSSAQVQDTDTSPFSFIPDASSFVLVASTKDALVKSVLPRLVHPSYSIQVLGMPNWSTFKGLDSEANPNPNILIPGFGNMLVNKAEREQFSSRYQNEFQVEESLTSFLGYDLVNYLLSVTDSGLTEQMNSSGSLRIKPYAFQFDFVPVVQDNRTRYYTNNITQLLKWEKGKFTFIKN